MRPEPQHFDDEVMTLDAQPIGDVYFHPILDVYGDEIPGCWVPWPEIRKAQIWESYTVRSILTKLPAPRGRN